MSENVFMFDSSEKDMIQAAEKARETFKYFWRELSWEYRRIIPGLGLSIVKFAFETEESADDIPSHEHMWISDIEFDGVNITGTLMNQPNWIHSLNEGDRITQPANLLTDWMYTLEDRAYGGYSVNVIRAGLSPAERKDHDDAWGLDFGDPNDIVITPYVPKKSGGLLSKVFGKSNAAPNDKNTQYPEHPMSINMGEKIREALSSNPEAINAVDEAGWTLIQREALAGNLPPIHILLEFGADPTIKNANGHSAVDLAQMMGWEAVIETLNT